MHGTKKKEREGGAGIFYPSLFFVKNVWQVERENRRRGKKGNCSVIVGRFSQNRKDIGKGGKGLGKDRGGGKGGKGRKRFVSSAFLMIIVAKASICGEPEGGEERGEEKGKKRKRPLFPHTASHLANDGGEKRMEKTHF